MSDTATQILPLLGADGFSNADPSFIRDWLIVLACFVGLTIGIMTLVDKFKGKTSQARTIEGQPINVNVSQAPATKGEISELRREVDSDLEQMRTEVGKVNERMDKIAENTSEMKGHLSAMSGNLKLLLDRHTK